MRLTKKKGWATVGALFAGAATLATTGPWYGAATLAGLGLALAAFLARVPPGARPKR